MTEEVLKEEQANPYNQKKAWHTGEDKPFESSEGLFFEKPSTSISVSRLKVCLTEILMSGFWFSKIVFILLCLQYS